MSLKIYSTVEKVVAKDERIIQQAGDTDGVIASFYDLSGNPSLFLDGTQTHLGNVGIKTITPNEALTVVGSVSTTHSMYVSAIYSSGDGNIYIGNNLIPISDTFYIGDANKPVNGIFISAQSLHLGSSSAGLSGLTLSNIDNVLTVSTGGLRSSIIYTGGLLLSGNNIGADPAVGSLPLTIGTNGLPAVQILTPLTVNSSVSAWSLSGVHYGDGSHLTNLPVTNPFNQSLNTTNSVTFNSVTLADGLSAHNTSIFGTLSASGLISQAPNLCVLALTTDQTLAATTDTLLNLSVKNDPNNWYVSGNKSIKPTSAGYYNAIAMVNFKTASNSNNQMNIQILKGSNTIALAMSPNNTSQPLTLVAQATVYCNGTTDEIKLQAYTGHNSGQTVTGTTDGNWTKLELIKIS